MGHVDGAVVGHAGLGALGLGHAVVEGARARAVGGAGGAGEVVGREGDRAKVDRDARARGRCHRLGGSCRRGRAAQGLGGEGELVAGAEVAAGDGLGGGEARTSLAGGVGVREREVERGVGPADDGGADGARAVVGDAHGDALVAVVGEAGVGAALVDRVDKVTRARAIGGPVGAQELVAEGHLGERDVAARVVGDGRDDLAGLVGRHRGVGVVRADREGEGTGDLRQGRAASAALGVGDRLAAGQRDTRAGGAVGVGKGDAVDRGGGPVTLHLVAHGGGQAEVRALGEGHVRHIGRAVVGHARCRARDLADTIVKGARARAMGVNRDSAKVLRGQLDLAQVDLGRRTAGRVDGHGRDGVASSIDGSRGTSQGLHGKGQGVAGAEVATGDGLSGLDRGGGLLRHGRVGDKEGARLDVALALERGAVDGYALVLVIERGVVAGEHDIDGVRPSVALRHDRLDHAVDGVLAQAVHSVAVAAGGTGGARNELALAGRPVLAVARDVRDLKDAEARVLERMGDVARAVTVGVLVDPQGLVGRGGVGLRFDDLDVELGVVALIGLGVTR